MGKLLIRFFKLFSGYFTRQGIDASQLFNIVETKLMMDKRRVHLQFRNQRKPKDENANRLNVVFILYGILSLFIAALMGGMQDIIIAMVVFHSYLVFMMAMTLVTDFSTVLLDTTDNLVILPRPVSSKTLFASRTVHILIYLFQFGIVISAFPVIITLVVYGIAPGLFLIVTSFSTVLLSVFFTYLLYLVILRFSNENKLREIVTYFQIFMAILFTAGYQILPRFLDLSLLDRTFSLHWYSYLVPPVWMAVALEAVEKNLYDAIHITMIVLAVFLPALLFWLVNKYFAPAFSRKLAMAQEDGTVQTKTREGRTYRRKLSGKISAIVCQSATERAAFEMTWKISGRDKQFRLQFYPSLGYMGVLIFVFIFRSGREAGNVWEHLRETNSFLWFIYIPLFMISSGMALTAFNENYQAGWVYYSSPLQRPGHLITGNLKSLFIKFFVPVFLLMLAFCLSIWGIKIIDDFIFGLLVNMNAFLIMAIAGKHYLPFSQQPNVQQQSGKFLQVILMLLLIALLIGLHWLGIKFPLVLYILAPVAIISGYFLLKSLQRLAWSEIAT